MRNSWEVHEKNHEKVMRKLQNKSWESNEKVIRKKKVRESHGKVIIKSWKSHEKFMGKSWESHETVTRKSCKSHDKGISHEKQVMKNDEKVMWKSSQSYRKVMRKLCESWEIHW